MDKKDTGEFVTMHDPRSGKEFRFPIIDGSVGPSVIDIR